MKTPAKSVLIASALFLAACQMPADTPPAEGSCGADALQHLIGAPVTAVQEIDTPEGMRVIGPGQPVTMDYRADRLNVEHDANDVITRIYCG